MAPPISQSKGAADKKAKRSKKRKSRTEVSSSSESETDNEKEPKVEKSRKAKNAASLDETPVPETAKKSKKEKKKSKSTPGVQDANGDVSMTGLDDEKPLASEKEEPSPSPVPQEDFTSIYLRKVTAELADDLDKVREANDFTNRSMPMLIHALKQGESIFSAEEKRRFVGAG